MKVITKYKSVVKNIWFQESFNAKCIFTTTCSVDVDVLRENPWNRRMKYSISSYYWYTEMGIRYNRQIYEIEKDRRYEVHFSVDTFAIYHSSFFYCFIRERDNPSNYLRKLGFIFSRKFAYN